MMETGVVVTRHVVEVQNNSLFFTYICYTSIPVTCPPLSGPNGRNVDCSLGDDGVPSFEDTCSINCATGYELTGNDTRVCQSDGSWSGINNVCRRSMYHTFIHNYIGARHI